ncbi:MAG: hypothetical protein K8F31_08405, partial [Roseovarius sp.]|nr:hypothetical protein [Roseovarius sp.]
MKLNVLMRLTSSAYPRACFQTARDSAPGRAPDPASQFRGPSQLGKDRHDLLHLQVAQRHQPVEDHPTLP